MSDNCEKNRQKVREFFTQTADGPLLDTMLAEDMTAWTTMSGPISKVQYQGMIDTLANMTQGAVEFTIDDLTAEGDKVVAEVRSKATLINGEEYKNQYVFVFRFNESGIVHVAEHYNAIVAREKLLPLMAKG